MPETQVALVPPNNGEKYIGCSDDFPDEIKELGDKIASLKDNKAEQLNKYMQSIYDFGKPKRK